MCEGETERELERAKKEWGARRGQGATNPLARRPGATKLSRRASKSNYHLPDSGK